MGSHTYVKEAVRNVETYIGELGLELKKKVTTALPDDYKPELDVSKEHNEEEVSQCHRRIGVMWWAAELGRVDICTEVSMMVAHSAIPMKGHLEAAWNMFAYLKGHDRSKIVFDFRALNLTVKTNELPRPDWSDFSKDVKEQIPHDAPEPRGHSVELTAFIDSDHTGDSVTRQSRTGIFLNVQASPIVWFSKKQTSIETSSFGSEFSAMKTAAEMVEGLRHKLRMIWSGTAASQSHS